MLTCYKAARDFFANEDGPAAIEYAIMLALIIGVCVATIGVTVP
jgi:Flp pilus assembly pilin Flp